MTLSEELEWRGFVHQTTLDSLDELNSRSWTFYSGYDASADSLTIGNLAAIMLKRCFMRHGHKAVGLVGGATSLIGDPGGKDSERVMQPESVIAANIAAVREQISRLLGTDAVIVNNIDWYRQMNVLEYLRDVGKHFSMTPLVQRDYIARRLGEGGSGISYTEFSYTLLQGYDFLHLYREHGVTLQLAGSDQWGNCLSGVDLIRRVENQEVHTLTIPLIINQATGKKFGKSEDGAVWLDAAKTSVYKFYQFWLNADDAGVEGYLKVYTELDRPAIEACMAAFESDRQGRAAQKTLAYEVTALVHGTEAAESVRRVSEVLFGGIAYTELTADDIQTIKQELPVVMLTSTDMPLWEIMVRAGLAVSNSEARRFLNDRAVYLNGRQLAADTTRLTSSDSLHGHVIIRRGRNAMAVIELQT